MKKILLLLITVLILIGCNNRETKKEKQITENNEMLSYTIDGEKIDIKPTKEDGYIVNKIICDNGSDIMWDNDNWEVELTKINSKDRCKVDFTKDTSKDGYRITVTSNMTSALDSLSNATTENGTVIIYSKAPIKNVTGCIGVIEDNKVIISNVMSNQTCNIEVEDKTLAGIIKNAYPPQPGRTDFTKIDNGIPALYTGEDDQGTTYYFSGDGTNMNNWVEFGNFTSDIYHGYVNETSTSYKVYKSLSECQNSSSYHYNCKLVISKGTKMLWRIIRINGNGSVRLLYAGDGNVATDVGKVGFNSNHNNPAYVGWKYSENGENGRGDKISSANYVISNWYNSNIKLSYGNFIDNNAIYCNDRRASTSRLNDSSYNTFTASISTEKLYFGAYKRLYNNGKPELKCDISDQFKDEFGLITADEVVAAGGLYEKNNSKTYYYLNKKASNGNTACTEEKGDPCSITGEEPWWTMTPVTWNGSAASMFLVHGSNLPGYFGSNGLAYGFLVRPIVSLKKEVLVTSGDGSANSPYEVQMP